MRKCRENYDSDSGDVNMYDSENLNMQLVWLDTELECTGGDH